MNLNATLIGQMVAFVIFIYLTHRFVWPPIVAALAERTKRIADGLQAADKAEKDLELAKQKVVEHGAEKILESSIDQNAHNELVNKLAAQL